MSYFLSCRLYKFSYRVDIALVSGDLADMPLELCHSAPPEETKAQHMLLDKVLEAFSPLASKVYYVPGNVSGVLSYSCIYCTPVDIFQFLIG